ncbi:MAG: outer membrane beta-barrel protein [Mariniphaga sp.]
MNRFILFLLTSSFLLICYIPVSAQEKTDSLSDKEKTSILNNFKHLTIGFYVDAYVNMELDHNRDTSDIVPYFANSPKKEQIRLNVAAIELFYNAEKVRGKLQLQFGDAPNLLATPEKQWIKNIRQATIGYRISKNLWTDVGFMFTPVGCESAWPVINVITTASMCAYFEPGALLGVKFSYKFSDKFNGGFMVGNPYSLAYTQTNHLAGILFLNYIPLKKLSVSYNCLFGNQALRDAAIKNNLLYNDILITYDPNRNLNLLGQFDFAFQTNSGMSPDTNKLAYMYSGFLQARYCFLDHFSIAGRYEYYCDPDCFLSGPFTNNGKTTGLSTNGISASLEYKPVKIGYIRFEYKYMHANSGNMIYYSGTSDYLNALIFTIGVRF